VRGTVAAAPAPQTGWWWAGGVLGAVVVGLSWRLRRVLAGVAIVAGMVVGGWILQSAGLAASPADGVGVQLLARLWPFVTAVGVVAVGGLALFKRVDIVVGIAGACLAVMVGLGDSAVFRYGTLAGPAWGRWAVVVALAVGVGLAVAGGIRWYQAVGGPEDSAGSTSADDDGAGSTSAAADGAGPRSAADDGAGSGSGAAERGERTQRADGN